MKKAISTEQTESNIAEILRLLSEAPSRLEHFSNNLSEQQLHQPIAPGERTFHQVLTHLINCESRSFDAITLALLANAPAFTPIHPERDFGKLFRFESLPFPDLLTYFKLRRTVLLPVLTSLPPGKWSRVIRQEGKQRKESVYWQARGLALHEWEHIQDLENKLKLP